jgi:hypothetical protein
LCGKDPEITGGLEVEIIFFADNKTFSGNQPADLPSRGWRGPVESFNRWIVIAADGLGREPGGGCSPALATAAAME